ncbi:MAG: hypothetical protein SNJ82_03675 [Gemmataceae bacterium]
MLRSILLLSFGCPAIALAGVADPQLRSDHPWYAGEASCSSWQRLFATQAALYQRVTGREVRTDEDKALAAWLWRNTHYWHGEEGVENLWGQGFGKGLDSRTREYWVGLYAHGFGLCGTTHCQWVAEMQELLGHARGRAVGTNGHSAFEVFLTGGPYGKGQWVLLDHDLSTVVFDPEGKRLLGMREIAADWKRLTDRRFRPERQRGWLICGLHPGDNTSYAQYRVAEYLAGYAGPPPRVHLRRGETLRRYLTPGLEDGKTFVFWGRNYNTAGIPGPERSHTWVNQPEAMFGSKSGSGYKPGQARFANAVFTYKPDFTSDDYKEGVLAEDDTQVTLEFQSPYIIAATPSDTGPWGIYTDGCRNGVVLQGKGLPKVSLSVDRGQTWYEAGPLDGSLDLTDQAKGYRQYWLRLHASKEQLRSSGLLIRTVCQANASVMPHLRDNGSVVQMECSDTAVVSAGPTKAQAQAHVVAGKFDSPSVTLRLATPRGEPALAVYGAAHLRSSSPPDPKITYQIEWSADGKNWQPVVKDWRIERQGDEPKDFWSQSFCWAETSLPRDKALREVWVRFRNNGGKSIARAEVHLAYRVPRRDDLEVTFAWNDAKGEQKHTHTVTSTKAMRWTVPTSAKVRTRWVEMRPVRR